MHFPDLDPLLFDGVLIKENHIALAGGLAAAVEACRPLEPEPP